MKSMSFRYIYRKASTVRRLRGLLGTFLHHASSHHTQMIGENYREQKA